MAAGAGQGDGMAAISGGLVIQRHAADQMQLIAVEDFKQIILRHADRVRTQRVVGEADGRQFLGDSNAFFDALSVSIVIALGNSSTSVTASVTACVASNARRP